MLADQGHEGERKNLVFNFNEGSVKAAEKNEETRISGLWRNAITWVEVT